MDLSSRNLINAADKEMVRIGQDGKSQSAKNHIRDGLSKADQVLYDKYAHYLQHIKDLGTNVQAVAQLRNNNRLAFEKMNPAEIFFDVVRADRLSQSQIRSLFDSCELYNTDCGENSPHATALKRAFVY